MKFHKLVILLIVIAGAVLIYWNFFSKKTSVKKALVAYASEIVQNCSVASYRPGCYEKEVPKVMDEGLTMEEAFDITRLIQEQDRSYAYCHVLGHNLSAKETAKDPSKWKEVIARSPSGLCSNGGIHGAFQERFRTESLTTEQIEAHKPEFRDICEPKTGWNPTSLQQATCYHALGHLMMYITDGEINPSVALCEDVSVSGTRDFSQMCFDGAFMQIFQPLEPEDFALIEGKAPKKEGLADFCSKFAEDKRESCWTEGWPLYRAEIMTPTGVVQYCSKMFLQRPAEQENCFLSMFYVVTAQVQFDLKKMKDYCSELPAKIDAQCYANVASRMIETDYRNIPTVIDFCAAAPTNAQETCYKELIKYSTYNFHKESSEYYQLCGLMPEIWRSQCLGQ